MSFNLKEREMEQRLRVQSYQIGVLAGHVERLLGPDSKVFADTLMLKHQSTQHANDVLMLHLRAGEIEKHAAEIHHVLAHATSVGIYFGPIEIIPPIRDMYMMYSLGGDPPTPEYLEWEDSVRKIVGPVASQLLEYKGEPEGGAPKRVFSEVDEEGA